MSNFSSWMTGNMLNTFPTSFNIWMVELRHVHWNIKIFYVKESFSEQSIPWEENMHSEHKKQMTETQVAFEVMYYQWSDHQTNQREYKAERSSSIKYLRKEIASLKFSDISIARDLCLVSFKTKRKNVIFLEY